MIRHVAATSDDTVLTLLFIMGNTQSVLSTPTVLRLYLLIHLIFV